MDIVYACAPLLCNNFSNSWSSQRPPRPPLTWSFPLPTQRRALITASTTNSILQLSRTVHPLFNQHNQQLFDTNALPAPPILCTPIIFTSATVKRSIIFLKNCHSWLEVQVENCIKSFTFLLEFMSNSHRFPLCFLDKPVAWLELWAQSNETLLYFVFTYNEFSFHIFNGLSQFYDVTLQKQPNDSTTISRLD